MKLLVPSLVVAVFGLSACTNSEPSPSELAVQMIESSDATDEAKACMTKVANGFEVPATFASTVDSLESALSTVAKGEGESNYDAAKQVVAAFEKALKDCN